MKTFVDDLTDEIRKKKSILVVGLDPQIRYIPTHILDRGYEEAKQVFDFEPMARAIVIYFKEIIKAVAPYVVAAKPQMGFYEAYGFWGVWAFQQVVQICKDNNLLVIEDAKRCDGGDTAKAYAKGHLGTVDVWDSRRQTFYEEFSLDVDAMTVVAWTGEACLNPFIEQVKKGGKGIFVVDKTSFKPNSAIEQLVTMEGFRVWEKTALLVKKWSEGCEGKCGINNVGVVMGATYPEDALKMKDLLPNRYKLVPGLGFQGANADAAVKSGKVIVNSSRYIDYAWLLTEEFKCDPKDYVQASEKCTEVSRDRLNEAMKRAGTIPW